MNHVTIDGLTLPRESPTDLEELSDRIRELAARGTAVYPVGGGLGLDYGRPPARAGVAVALTQLDRIVDYPVEDLTITVEAGMTITKLQELLGKNNQRLPIDVPYPERATIGGAIAVNAAGPRRLAYGTWRDWIIGMTVVNDRGELCKSGGRVVKNVAGYDLGKLYTGSLGALGIVAQVTLKLQPMPESLRWIGIDAINANEVGQLIDTIAASATQPRAVELVSGNGGFDLHLLLEDNAESVAWQAVQLERELGPKAIRARSDAIERLLNDRAVVDSQPLQFIATMPSSQVGDFLGFAATQRWTYHAHAMNGIVWVGCSADTCLDAEAIVRSASQHCIGNIVVRRCPVEWKANLPIWGRTPASIELMRKVKREFDPNNVLNAGRTSI